MEIPVTESLASGEMEKNKGAELSVNAVGDDTRNGYASTGSTSPIALSPCRLLVSLITPHLVLSLHHPINMFFQN